MRYNRQKIMARPFEARLNSLKKDFQKNVAPVLRKKRFARSKSEAKRIKHLRALMKLKRAEKRWKNKQEKRRRR